jgi:hypothetical protein
VTGIAHHVASLISNAELLASAARSLPLVPTLTHTVVATAMLHTVTCMGIRDLILMAVVVIIEAMVLFHSEQVTGDAALKAAHTTTLPRTSVACAVVLQESVLQLSLISHTHLLWPRRLILVWLLQARWAMPLVPLGLDLVRKRLALVLLSPKMPTMPMLCPQPWVLQVQAFRKWVA